VENAIAIKEGGADLEKFMTGLVRRNPGETEFHQAVQEVAETLVPFISNIAKYRDAQILERMTEPDRVIIFRVCWVDDENNVRVNRGYRIQFNNAIGPYKGGLRFHPDVNLSTFKFLGFEQVFKNSLTGLPIGGGKGGSNFNPKGKSEGEVMRFCQAFMTELYRHIGKDTDVPAGDIGVGAREVSYLFGQYKRIANNFTGVLTGKGLAFGGSLVRTEATGYGCVYMMEEMLKTKDKTLKDRITIISGSGNVAQYTAQKAIQFGAKVVTMSDSSGFIYDKNGIDQVKLNWIKDLKNKSRGRIKEYAENFGAEFHEGKRPWGVKCELAFPCATQNELNAEEAQQLIDNGCTAVSEGSNMPTTIEGIHHFIKSDILYAPSKAANAGGVAVSALEMSQNSMRLSWKDGEVNEKLHTIMKNIHAACVKHGTESNGKVNYVKGANIAGFVKVADAMCAFGVL